MQVKLPISAEGHLIATLQQFRHNKNEHEARQLLAYLCNENLELHPVLGNYLVPALVECGILRDAQHIFDNLPHRNEYSWTSLICGFIQSGEHQHAFHLYHRMKHEKDSVKPNRVTYLALLNACTNLEDTERGKTLHADIVERGLEMHFFMGSPVVGNTLVVMYGKCSMFAEAQKVFDGIRGKDVVSWNALISGYAEHGFLEDAVNCLTRMQMELVSADAVTFVLCLKACGNKGALETGREIHAQIRKSGLEKVSFVGNALVDMYGKCGSSAEGREVFDDLPVRDVVAWNTMISTYGENHEGDMAVCSFTEMQQQGVKPNCTTFTCLLAACSHASLVLKGQEFFKAMKEEHGIEPAEDHYACMADLFARSGHVYDALRFVLAMQCPPSMVILMSLLTACKIYGEVEVGEGCFQQLVEASQDSAATYMLMADLYGNYGRWHDARRIEGMRKYLQKEKRQGSTLIEVKKKLHEFAVGVKQSKELLDLSVVLSLHMKNRGFVPDVNLVYLMKGSMSVKGGDMLKQL